MFSATEQVLEAEMNRLKLAVKTLQGEDKSEEIYIGSYLLARLEELGVTSMFGVPGDFNLGFLDLVEDHPTIDWVGNCNELNASYAADGYARVKHGSVGVLLTTFGVGELSAMNGMAGAFSEMVPMVHIAGVPSLRQQATKPMLHHTLGDGRYDAYTKAAEQFTYSQAILTSAISAAAEIDRVLSDCVIKGRPVYITLPTDLAYAKISSDRLKIPLPRHPSPNDPEVEAFVIDEIVKQVEEADGDVVVIADACAIRHDAIDELKDLLHKTGYPVYAAPMGKSAIDETYERYGGIYVGSISRPEIKEKVESAKLILSIGSLKSDFNSGNFTYSIPTTRTVELHSHWTKIKYADFPEIGMKQLLPKLTARLEGGKAKALQLKVPHFDAHIPQENDDVISQAWFWPTMSKFLKPKDVVIAETGTSSFGILDVPLPKDSVFLAQILWGSIGWTVGSTLGAALAAKDCNMNRTILFVGDGSLQLTVQELSTMLRKGLKPLIFVLNNSGYTIERFLHGKERKYNDIMNWKWTGLLEVLGDIDGTLSKSYTVNNKNELTELLENPKFAAAEVLQLVEVMMPKHDAPRALQVQAELSGKTNQYAL
ncbi:pyruvate decarboxylase [Lentinula detonsa]|uniref:Pyruvate decarboxylase n=1 Tax=Lentinula detonsa TaxID=2804962 RepID=A0A9W8U0D9_9AGAR|nr:pyruvate decarboxylase [Lentinula detonsa]